MYKFPINKVLTSFAALLLVAACSDQNNMRLTEDPTAANIRY